MRMNENSIEFALSPLDHLLLMPPHPLTSKFSPNLSDFGFHLWLTHSHTCVTLASQAAVLSHTLETAGYKHRAGIGLWVDMVLWPLNMLELLDKVEIKPEQ